MILVEIVWAKINPFTTLIIFWKAILAMCVWMKMALLRQMLVSVVLCTLCYTWVQIATLNIHPRYK